MVRGKVDQVWKTRFGERSLDFRPRDFGGVEDNRDVLHSPSLGAREGRLEAVIDINLLREQPEAIKASQVARGADVSLVDQAVKLDLDKRAALAEFERLRAAQNQHGKLVATAPKEDKAALVAQGQEMAVAVKAADAAAPVAEEAAAE